MVQLAFYESTAQIIPVLLLAEIARGAWLASVPDRFVEVGKKWEAISREHKQAEEEYDKIEATFDRQQAEIDSAGHPQVYVDALTEHIVRGRTDLAEARRKLAVDRSKAGHERAEFTLERKGIERLRTYSVLGMAAVMLAECLALYLCLAVLGNPRLNSDQMAMWVASGMAIGLAGTVTQVLNSMHIREPQSGLQKVAQQIQYATPAVVGLGSVLLWALMRG